MKFKIIFLLIATVFLFSSFENTTTREEEIKQWLDNNYNTLYQSSVAFVLILQENGSEEQSKYQYSDLQKQFRTIQFLLDHISEETVKRYMNGAPLPSVEQNIPAVNILEPRGLQVIDELLFKDSIDHEEILKKALELKAALEKTKNVFISNELGESDIKRAILKAIIRLYTIQVTGFDTPGSKTGLENSVNSLTGISELLNTIYSEQTTVYKIAESIDLAKKYIQDNNDFNSFNRVIFYKDYIKPILSLLQQWETNDLPIIYRNPNEKTGLNYQTEELFSLNLFNMDYYANLPKDIINNPEVIALGKQLFYDPILSGNHKMSCGTCHQPSKAFTDGLQTSITNEEGVSGIRNTPTLITAILSKGYFYDLREEDANRQIVHVVKNKSEFNSDFLDIIEKLQSDKLYNRQFKHIFPDVNISKYSITAAITSYVTSLSNFDSPFDKYMRGEVVSIAPEVIRGFNLFAGKASCATCHFIPTFSGLVPPLFKESESEVLGVPQFWNVSPLTLDPDPGRIASGKPQDEAEHLRHSFKTTTVRNIEFSAPYMHNGSFKNLDDLMDFYNKGGGAGMGLDVHYQTLPKTPLNLTLSEISDIKSFMNMLTSTVAY